MYLLIFSKTEGYVVALLTRQGVLPELLLYLYLLQWFSLSSDGKPIERRKNSVTSPLRRLADRRRTRFTSKQREAIRKPLYRNFTRIVCRSKGDFKGDRVKSIGKLVVEAEERKKGVIIVSVRRDARIFYSIYERAKTKCTYLQASHRGESLSK